MPVGSAAGYSPLLTGAAAPGSSLSTGGYTDFPASNGQMVLPRTAEPGVSARPTGHRAVDPAARCPAQLT